MCGISDICSEWEESFCPAHSNVVQYPSCYRAKDTAPEIKDAIAILNDRKSWQGIKGNETLEKLIDFLIIELEK